MSSPCRSSRSSWTCIDAARYFPHCPPEAAQTFWSTLTASYENFGARGFRGRFATCRPTPGGRAAAATSRRLALSRDHPVTSTTWSRTRPLSFFAARAYALAYLLVTSARDVIDNSLLMPRHAHRFAGIPT